MLRALFLFLCLSFVGTASAQQFQLGFGFGLGSVVSSNEDFSEPMKGLGFLEARYRLNENFGVGLEWTGGGNVNPFDYFKDTQGIPPVFEFSPNDTRASAFMGKFIYYLPTHRKLYLALGLGLAKTKLQVNIQDVEPIAQVSRHNYAFQPEVGIQLGGFNISYKYLALGSSPSFTHTNVHGEFFFAREARLAFSVISFAYLFRF